MTNCKTFLYDNLHFRFEWQTQCRDLRVQYNCLDFSNIHNLMESTELKDKAMYRLNVLSQAESANQREAW